MKPSILKGWDVPKQDYVNAHEINGLTKLVIDLSNVCNLSCPGCFTKRVEGGWSGKSKKRLANELTYKDQRLLLEEAAQLGAKTVDIVGAGEPTLDPKFYDIVEDINNLGMHAVVFTHGVSNALAKPERWADKNVSFFVKLWSRNHNLQDRYVSGSIPEYASKRDAMLEGLLKVGFGRGDCVTVDDIDYTTTRLGADILVMQSNYEEIPDLFRFCREHSIQPEIKTYIPEGPTRFDQEQNMKQYDSVTLAQLKEDEVSPEGFQALRKELVAIDKNEFSIDEMKTIYPQGSKCTQSMAALYVTITGDIRSCVGTHHSYGIYRPGQDMLKSVLEQRKENVGFGCVPRIEDAQLRSLRIDPELQKIYSDGLR